MSVDCFGLFISALKDISVSNAAF